MIVIAALALLSVPFVYALFEYLNHIRTLSKYPSGPFPLPVIGNLHLLGTQPHKVFRDLAKKYGDVFGISFGMNRVVIVNAIEPAKEAFLSKGTDFIGRPKGYMASILSRNYTDMVFTDYGPLWTFQRKLGHKSLSLFGDGSGSLEGMISRECSDLLERLRNANGEPVDVHLEFGRTILNVVCTMLFGDRYDATDKEFIAVVRSCELVCDGLSNGDPVSFLPWLRFFPQGGLEKLKKGIAIKDPIVRRKLLEHKESFDPNHIRDFTDSLLKTSKEEKVWQHAGIQNLTDDHLEMILYDMFIAGVETSTSALRWLIVYLLHWPNIQNEMNKEIIKVVGTQRYPELNDREHLHLCQATIQETLRLSSLTPLGLPRKAIKDSSINGQNIPKDTQILFNYWNIHHDPREWSDPETFNPHRWLDESGNYVPGRHRSFLPFSAGRRNCVGESLAKKELFLVVTHFVRDFSVVANNNEPFPSLDGGVGVTLAPDTFTAVFIPRN